MLILGIASAVTAVTLVVLTCCVIPVLFELKKTAISLRTVTETMNAEMKPLIRELREMVADVHEVTRVAATSTEGVQLLMDELGQAGQNIRSINRVASGVSGLVANSSVWMTGARVAGRFIVDKLLKKRG